MGSFLPNPHQSDEEIITRAVRAAISKPSIEDFKLKTENIPSGVVPNIPYFQIPAGKVYEIWIKGLGTSVLQPMYYPGKQKVDQDAIAADTSKESLLGTISADATLIWSPQTTFIAFEFSNIDPVTGAVTGGISAYTLIMNSEGWVLTEGCILDLNGAEFTVMFRDVTKKHSSA